MTDTLTLHALAGVPMIAAGDDLVAVIEAALASSGLALQDGDVLVLAQKIVSKAEGRTVDLRGVTPRREAVELARVTDKDPRVVELILTESTSILRQVRGVLITEHRRGWIMANAGIDASNVASVNGEENVLLLPEDPDASCADLHRRLCAAHGVRVGVVISDSFGRPWRLGTTGVAIGAAGLPSLWDRRGERDLYGREMMVTEQAVGDELATAAALLQGQGAEGRPVVLIRGARFGDGSAPERPAADLIRDPAMDLFR